MTTCDVTPPSVWIVCGGSHPFGDSEAANRIGVRGALYDVRALTKGWLPTVIVLTGASQGLDELAEEWAHHQGIAVEFYPATARWGGGVPAVTPHVVANYAPALVVMFPGGTLPDDVTGVAVLATVSADGSVALTTFPKRDDGAGSARTPARDSPLSHDERTAFYALIDATSALLDSDLDGAYVEDLLRRLDVLRLVRNALDAAVAATDRAQKQPDDEVAVGAS